MKNKHLIAWLRATYGRQSELARELGVTPGAIHQWATKKVPAERVYEISVVTGIPAGQIRPDLEKQRRKAS